MFCRCFSWSFQFNVKLSMVVWPKCRHFQLEIWLICHRTRLSQLCSSRSTQFCCMCGERVNKFERECFHNIGKNRSNSGKTTFNEPIESNCLVCAPISIHKIHRIRSFYFLYSFRRSLIICWRKKKQKQQQQQTRDDKCLQ